MSVRPRILCIAGSPRRNGNSDRLLDRVAQGVEQEGGDPVRLVASMAGIETCRGCNSCSRTGECVIRDGMDDVYRALDGAHAIAVVSPVYFASVPGVLKLLYDRCQPYWARRFVLGEPAAVRKRPGAVIVVGGGGDRFGTGCAIAPTESVLGILGVSVHKVLEVVGPDAPGEVLNYPRELDAALEIGRDLAASARSHDTRD